MSTTPEQKVKALVYELLDRYEHYRVATAGSVFMKRGTPDILVCLSGKFIGIEVKAANGKPTLLQLDALREINDAGGIGLLISEATLVDLRKVLKQYGSEKRQAPPVAKRSRKGDGSNSGGNLSW